MNIKQVKDSSFLFLGNTIIKLSNFAKQMLLAFYLGVSSSIDIYLMAMIVPTILAGMTAGGAGEIIVTKLKTDNKGNFIELFISALFFIIVGIVTVYLFTIKYWGAYFDLDAEQANLFFVFSYIFTLNLIPGFFSSVLQPLLYSKGFYKFYVFRTIISEVIAIGFILLTVKSLGIYSFALAISMSVVIQAALYLYKLKFNYKAVLLKNNWKINSAEIILTLKQTFLLGLQTLVNQMSTFWQRVLSVRYLAPGYLSSFNYAKNLSQLPSSIFLSSILTTTYIEQSKIIRVSFEEFLIYTRKMFTMFVRLSVVAQILLIAFSPLILILFYRRGEFDNNAVQSSLVIFQILSLGFGSNLLFSFLSRTFYIVSMYNKLFIALLIKTIFEVGLLIIFIKDIPNILPVAFVISSFIVIGILMFLLNNRYNNMIDIKTGAFYLTTALIASTILLYLYSKSISFIINLPLYKLIISYSILAVVLLIPSYFILKDNVLVKSISKRASEKFNKKKSNV